MLSPMATSREVSVYDLIRKRRAVIAPTSPPIYDKTADIFCIYLV